MSALSDTRVGLECLSCLIRWKLGNHFATLSWKETLSTDSSRCTNFLLCLNTFKNQSPLMEHQNMASPKGPTEEGLVNSGEGLFLFRPWHSNQLLY